MKTKQEKTLQGKIDLLCETHKKTLSVLPIISSLENLLLGDTASLKKIQIVIRKVGQLLEADRCILFLIANTKQKVAESWQWCREPKFSISTEKMNLVFSEHPQTMGTLHGQKPVVMEKIRTSISVYPVLGERLRNQGLKSVFIQGIYNHGQLTGFLDLDYLSREKQFADFETALLKGVSNLFSLFFTKLSQQRMLEKVTSAMPNMLFVKDADDGFRYRFGNARFAEFFGINSNQLPGKTDKELFDFDPELAEKYRQDDQGIMESGHKIDFHESCTRPNGELSYQHTIKYPVKMEDGSRLLVGIASDVTDLRLSEIREKCSARILDALSQDQTLEGVLSSLFSTVISNIPWCARLVFVRIREDGSREVAYEQTAGTEYQISQEDRILLERYLTWDLLALKPKNSYFCKDLCKLIPELHCKILRSCSAAPVYTGKQLHGYLLFFSRTISRNDHSMESFLLLIREMIASTLQRLKQTQLVKDAEQFSRQLIQSISLPIFVYDSAGRIIQLNTAAEALGIRVSNTPFLCRKIFRCSHPEKECVFRKVLESRESCSTEAVCKDRKYRLVYSPVLSGDGTVRRIVCCAEDITKLSRKLDCVQQINRFLDFLLTEDDMWSAIRSIIGKWGTYLHADWCFLLSYPRKNFFQCEFQKTTPGCPALFRDFAKGPCNPEAIGPDAFRNTDFLSFPDCRKKETGQLLMQFPENTEKISSFYIHSVRRNGKVWGCLALGFQQNHVLTPEEEEFCRSGARCVELMLIRNDYHQSLKSAVTKVQNAEQEKSLFLTALNHEIRTPLNAVLGLAEVLQSEDLSTEQRKEYLNSISSAGGALRTLIAGVFDLGKSTEQLRLTPVEADMRSLIEECRGIFTEECRRKSVGQTVRMDRNFPRIITDLTRMRQLLFSLIGNAVKLSNHGSIVIECIFTPKDASAGTLHLHVTTAANTAQKKGTSVNSEVHEDPAAGNRQSLCRSLVEKMNGKFLVKKRFGKSISFEVALPDIRWKVSSSAVRPSTAEKTVSQFRKTILIVDDIPLNLEVLSVMLRQAGITVEKAQTVKQALEILKTKKIGCVLTDLWMPGMNGADLAETIRANPEYREIPIAALTADETPAETFDMSLFDAVFFKPVAIQEILEFLRDKN